jgi:hypothetical protein
MSEGLLHYFTILDFDKLLLFLSSVSLPSGSPTTNWPQRLSQLRLNTGYFALMASTWGTLGPGTAL